MDEIGKMVKRQGKGERRLWVREEERGKLLMWLIRWLRGKEGGGE